MAASKAKDELSSSDEDENPQAPLIPPWKLPKNKQPAWVKNMEQPPSSDALKDITVESLLDQALTQTARDVKDLTLEPTQDDRYELLTCVKFVKDQLARLARAKDFECIGISFAETLDRVVRQCLTEVSNEFVRCVLVLLSPERTKIGELQRKEAEIKKKLMEAQRDFLKEVTMLRGGASVKRDETLDRFDPTGAAFSSPTNKQSGDDGVEYGDGCAMAFDPLNYLDQDTRELVENLVQEKLALIASASSGEHARRRKDAFHATGDSFRSQDGQRSRKKGNGDGSSPESTSRRGSNDPPGGMQGGRAGKAGAEASGAEASGRGRGGDSSGPGGDHGGRAGGPKDPKVALQEAQQAQAKLAKEQAMATTKMANMEEEMKKLRQQLAAAQGGGGSGGVTGSPEAIKAMQEQAVAAAQRANEDEIKRLREQLAAEQKKAFQQKNAEARGQGPGSKKHRELVQGSDDGYDPDDPASPEEQAARRAAKENERMKEELERMKALENGIASSCATHGPRIAELELENKQLKEALDEIRARLQTALGELDKYQKGGSAKTRRAMDGAGLSKDLMNQSWQMASVFKRLYEEAQERKMRQQDREVAHMADMEEQLLTKISERLAADFMQIPSSIGMANADIFQKNVRLAAQSAEEDALPFQHRLDVSAGRCRGGLPLGISKRMGGGGQAASAMLRLSGSLPNLANSIPNLSSTAGGAPLGGPVYEPRARTLPRGCYAALE